MTWQLRPDGTVLETEVTPEAPKQRPYPAKSITAMRAAVLLLKPRAIPQMLLQGLCLPKMCLPHAEMLSVQKATGALQGCSRICQSPQSQGSKRTAQGQALRTPTPLLPARLRLAQLIYTHATWRLFLGHPARAELNATDSRKPRKLGKQLTSQTTLGECWHHSHLTCLPGNTND